MLLSDVYEALSSSELNSYFAGLDGSGDISESHKSAVINSVNRGLVQLWTKFPHKLDYVKLSLLDDVYSYTVSTKYAASNNKAAIQYVLDSEADPIGSVLRVIDATCTLDDGITVPVFSQDPYSFFGVSQLNGATAFRIGKPNVKYTLDVLYQPAPEKLPSYADDLEEFELHPALHDALIAYVAWKILSGKGSAEATAQAQQHMATYNAVCSQVAMDNTIPEPSPTRVDKFSIGGFR